ncbi:hypothetical protein [Micromonospora sp. NPDC051141]|uniref:hypothetical protein n=1 Tax=Micromonospora sp. NPDC051141 TaxID=3364284 RepID=UPI0037AE20CC
MSYQLRRDSMPGRAGTGMSMDEKNRVTSSGMPDTKLHLSHVNPLVREVMKHEKQLSGRPTGQTSLFSTRACVRSRPFLTAVLPRT